MIEDGDKESAIGPVHLSEDLDTGDKFLIYGTDTGIRVELRLGGDTFWMTQAQMAELFGVNVRTVSEHLSNVFGEGELSEEATIRNFRIVRSEGPRQVSRDINHYNLDVVISVGYRVSSKQGTLFRKWATGVLVQFATKGFVIDAERLKNPTEYDRIIELRDIIRDIRASEANVYAELRRICAMCQDYDPHSEMSREFYQHTQAKLFWAVTSRTPSMILVDRADASKANMGLQVWPKADVRQQDALVAKNYLSDAEIRELNRLTTILLDIFDDQLDIGKLTLMSQASDLLDQQLQNLNRAVLRHGGSMSHALAESRAKAEYQKFDAKRREIRKQEADRQLAELKTNGKRLPKGIRSKSDIS